MSSYFKLHTFLSRKDCTYVDNFYYRDATGRLAEVRVAEDGFVCRSAAAFRKALNPAWPGKPGEKTPVKYIEVEGDELGLPFGAVSCAPAAYEAALQLVLGAERKKEEERLKEKAFMESLKSGMLRNQHAAEEADVAEPLRLQAPHFLADFTVLDLEFQGTDLLELAAVRYQDWQPINTLQSFIRFRGPLNYHVTNLTGISAQDVWNAPEERKVLQQFKQLAGDSLLVCHNRSADRRILEAARTRQGAPAPLANDWFCTLALAKQRLPKRKHGLGELCADFGIATHGAHRAMRDVEMCFGLLLHLHQMEPINGPLVVKAKGRKAAQGTASLFTAAA